MKLYLVLFFSTNEKALISKQEQRHKLFNVNLNVHQASTTKLLMETLLAVDIVLLLEGCT